MEQQKHKIICGDCLEHLKQIEDKSIDAIVTDPPYGISFMGRDWDKAVPSKEVWQECLRVLKPGAFMFCMSLPRQDVLSRMIVNIEDVGFNVAFPSVYHTFACVSEDTEVFTQYGWMQWEQLQKNIYMYKILILPEEVQKTFPFLIVPKENKASKNKGLECKQTNAHPTVKSLKLISYLITIASRENDTILDPYVGSGTTLVAAEMLKRNAIGIDISAEYCNIAYHRLSSEFRQIRLDRKPSIVEKVNF